MLFGLFIYISTGMLVLLACAQKIVDWEERCKYMAKNQKRKEFIKKVIVTVLLWPIFICLNVHHAVETYERNIKRRYRLPFDTKFKLLKPAFITNALHHVRSKIIRAKRP